MFRRPVRIQSHRQNLENMRVINLFGGPGTGKSTTAAALFALMKREGYNVELVTEFAKDLVWTERNKELNDEVYIFGKMYHKLWRLRDKVDYVIIDSPLPTCLYYDNERIDNFRDFVLSAFHTFKNTNFLLKRNFKYQEEGRVQTEEEADLVDKDIRSMLERDHIYILKEVCPLGDIKPEEEILELIKVIDS